MVRTEFSERVRVCVYHNPEDPKCKSRTKQAFAKEVNINSIMRKAAKTGVLPVVLGQPMYGDFSNVGDFLAVQLRMQAVEDAFMSLPASIRAKFRNSPADYVDFMVNPANKDEAIKLGLMKLSPEAEKAAADAKAAAAKAEAGAAEAATGS